MKTKHIDLNQAQLISVIARKKILFRVSVYYLQTNVTIELAIQLRNLFQGAIILSVSMLPYLRDAQQSQHNKL